MIRRLAASRHVRTLVILAGIAVALAHAAGLLALRPVEQIDLAIGDARLRATLPATRDPRIVIVDIDPKSLGEIGRWPWDRRHLAALIDALFEHQRAAVVGFDMLFADEARPDAHRRLEALAARHPELTPHLGTLKGEADDDALLTAALRNRPVVLGFYFEGDDADQRSGALPPALFERNALADRPIAFTHWPGYTASLPHIAAAAPAAGFINSLPDADGVVRHLPLIAEHQERHYAALALAVFRRYAGDPAVVPLLPRGRLVPDGYDGLAGIALQQAGRQVVIPVDSRVAVQVPYRGPGGPRGGSFEYLSAADVLQGRVAPGHLEGKLVLVGSTAPALFDLRPTPISEVFPGVEVHANVLSGLLDGRLPVRPDWARGAEFAQVLLVAVVLGLALPRLGALPALLLTLATTATLLAANVWLYAGRGIDLPVASSLLLIAMLYGGTTVWGHIAEAHTRRSLARLFGAYVPPELVSEMARDPERYDMRAENRVLTIMFCDMRNFTRIAEALPPEDLRALVNRFFSRMTAAIRAQRGTLDKYIGDAIMAFWGAPLPDGQHAAHAVRAALEMVRRMRALNEDLRRQQLPELGLGVGLNTGLVCVGDMGSDIRRSYTVMGDAVNLASRIEALTRHYGLDILVGEDTRHAVNDPDLAWVEVDRVRVKGKQQPVTLFTPVEGVPSGAPEFEEEMRLWRLALTAHRQQDWVASDTALSELRRRYPQSTFAGLYQHFAARNQTYRDTPPPLDWDSAHTFDSK